jgi:hypothetical protein
MEISSGGRYGVGENTIIRRMFMGQQRCGEDFVIG